MASKPISITQPEELHKQAVAWCKDNNTTFSSHITHMWNKLLKSEKDGS